MAEGNTNKSIEATWGIALRVWWWMFWRSILGTVVGAFIIGFIIGFILGALGLDVAIIENVSSFIGGIIGLGVSIFFTKEVIGEKFKDVSLVLVKTEDVA